MGDEQEAANRIIAEYMGRVAELIRVRFPFHWSALNGQMVGRRLTTDRWNQIAAVLASFYSIPGFALSPSEHEIRNVVLSSVLVAQKMAAASFGGKDPDGSRNLALWRAAELGTIINRRKTENDG